MAQDPQRNSPIGAAIADSNGHYFLTLPASSYNLLAGMPNYYYDQSLAPSVILTNGMAATNNLYLTNGTVTISGNVYDAATSNGIGGPLLTLQSAHLFAITFTDTNGNYSAAVTPSFWKIQPTKQRLARRAYVLPQATFQVDTTGGNVTNANIALPRGNALFYGHITDNSNKPCPIGTPVISAPQRLSPTRFGFNLIGASNVSYTVEASTNLASTNWTSLFSLQLTNGSSFVTDQTATNSPRFYRVKKN